MATETYSPTPRSTPDHRPVVLVTGTSSGIGLALARKLWDLEQYRVVITARSHSLTKIHGELFHDNERFLVRSLDVTSAIEREHIIHEIESRWGSVDILVNNAGISYRAVFEHMAESDMQTQFATNFFGPMALTRLVLPGMRKKHSGRIINISSVSGMMAMPTMSAYSASKFALEGATEALWYEMRPWNVSVSLLQPGFIHSESFRNVYTSEAARHAMATPGDVYANYYRSMAPFVERMMGRAVSTPEKIADVILRTMRKRHPSLRVAVTIDARLFGLLRRLLPRELYHRLLYRGLPGISQWGDHRAPKP